MITPWDASVYFEFEQECDGISFGLECESCGLGATWEQFYSGLGCPGETRYLCDICHKEDRL
jgi:hypothetical protein